MEDSIPLLKVESSSIAEGARSRVIHAITYSYNGSFIPPLDLCSMDAIYRSISTRI